MVFTNLQKIQLRLSVNNEDLQVLVDPRKTLLEVLREDLGLNGTKHGCELGECGACTVLRDGKPVLSCMTLALECEDVAIETIEGMAVEGELHPLQLSFAEQGGLQCGYCTPGMLMTAKALLESETNPGSAQIREALSGNLCRCTGYQQIIESVERAAAMTAEAGDKPGGSKV
jgi:carbon-monoxide dehydrogenase small subunit